MLRSLSCVILVLCSVGANGRFRTVSSSRNFTVWKPPSQNFTVWKPPMENFRPWKPPTGPWVPPINTAPGSRYPPPINNGNPPANGRHNFFWGTKASTDRLLYFTRVKANARFMRKATKDVAFPPKRLGPAGIISYMEVLDQKAMGEGGFVSIQEGGIGCKNVTLHFVSQRNKDLDFIVNIFGY